MAKTRWPGANRVNAIKHTKQTIRLQELYGGLLIYFSQNYYVTSYGKDNNIILTCVGPTACGNVTEAVELPNTEAVICRIES